MVEQTDFENAFSFYDEVFQSVPNQYRVVSQDLLAEASQAPKKKSKDQGLSLNEIFQRAQAKIEEIRKTNRDKSLSAIAELTKQHKLSKSKKEARMEEDLNSDSDMADETQ